MKKNFLFKVVCVGISFLLAWGTATSLVFAGNITVNNNVDVAVTNGTVTINSSGNIDQIRVDVNDVFITSSAGSYTVTSAKDLTVVLATGASISSEACNSGTKTVTINVTSGSPEVRFTPFSAACGGIGGGTGGGGGGGGGGGYVSPPIIQTATTPTAIATASKATATDLTAQLLVLENKLKQLGASPLTPGKERFANDLYLGAKGDAVTDLQKVLACLYPDSELAKTGSTGFYGQLTMKIVQLFQKDNNVKPNNGRAGPLTRKTLREKGGSCLIASGGESLVQSSEIKPSAPAQGLIVTTGDRFLKNLYLKSKGEDVNQLQKILICLYPDSQLAQLGITGYFGTVTLKVAQTYQKDKNISPPSGRIGPLTRTALNSGTGVCYQ